MRGDHEYTGLYMRPATNIPDLRRGSSGVYVTVEPADAYALLNSMRHSALSTLAMASPVVKTTTRRGHPDRFIERPAPIKVGSQEQMRIQQERQRLIDGTKRRGCN